MANASEKPPKDNGIPKQVSRKDFKRYLLPHLKKRVKGPEPKLSFYKIFNYIRYVLHTGIQRNQLRTRRNQPHGANVYKWHHRWSKEGSYENLFRHPASTCLIGINLIRPAFMEMVQTPS